MAMIHVVRISPLILKLSFSQSLLSFTDRYHTILTIWCLEIFAGCRHFQTASEDIFIGVVLMQASS